MVLHMYVAELVAPVLIFIPGIARLIAAALMASLHMGIALTGNYTFLNFLSIVLCVPLFSDRWLRPILPKALCRAVEAAQVEGSPSRFGPAKTGPKPPDDPAGRGRYTRNLVWSIRRQD